MFGLKSNVRVGLDIGSHAVKMVICERGAHNRQRLIKAVSRDIYSGQEKYDPEGPRKAAVVPVILEMFQEVGIRPRAISHLGSCIGGLNQATKEIRSLQLPEEEMNSTILNEARKHLPLDGSESVVDYQVMGEDPKDADKVRILVAATTKRVFDAHADILRELELKPGVVDLEPLAAVNSYLGHGELPDEGVVVFLNLGARRTNMIIIGRKDMFFSRDLPIGGYAFTEEIMKRLDLKFAEAEDIKKFKGVPGASSVKAAEPGAGAFALTERSALEKLGEEINRSLRYYVKETGQSFFARFVLVGGAAESSELREFIEKKFNIEVTVYDPFVSMDGVTGDLRQRAQFAAAVGLAVRAQGV